MSANYNNLIGIVPVSGTPTDYNMPWEDVFIPINSNFMAVERAILECAFAGCDTVWLIGHDTMQPFLRKRIGDYIKNPRYPRGRRDKDRNTISIYYCPIDARDRLVRHSTGWSVLHGVYMAHRFFTYHSKNLGPDKFYIAWPFGIIPYENMVHHRESIKNNQITFFSVNGKTAKDSMYLPMVLTYESIKEVRRDIIFNYKKMYDKTTEEKIGTILLKKDQAEAKKLSIGEIFSKMSCKHHIIELGENYWDISSWQKYCKFLGENDGSIKLYDDDIIGGYEYRRLT